MQYSLLAAALGASAVTAYPFVATSPGVDSSMLGRRNPSLNQHSNYARQQSGGSNPGGPLTCPYIPWEDHVPAPGITDEYPYNGAKNGMPGNGKGGYQVPAPGDTAHQFIAPDYTKDVRGPCPGLNTAANHGFLARDGITTFNELVDAQQNLYNVGYDLAVLLALLGLTLTDGDIATERLSIGCDATNRTAYVSALVPPPQSGEPGLDGHNKFEADTSLTRNDYFLGKGDNFNFNGTLFGMMTETTSGLYNRDNLAKYRYQRFQESLAENPNFYFGPLSLLLYGASSFLYELMPSGPDYIPDYNTISSFFGAKKNADGTYSFTGQEKIPESWTNRVSPYTDFDVGVEIFAQYFEYPVLFGGATGNGGYDLINFGYIKNGTLIAPPSTAAACLLYQLVGERVPSGLNAVLIPTVDALNFITQKLGLTGLQNLGCPSPLT